jgi:serine/threonine protein kinase
MNIGELIDGHYGKLNEWDLCRIGLQVSLGVEHLHDKVSGCSQPMEQKEQHDDDVTLALLLFMSQGIVHRDIKPENIMFGPTGAREG